MERLILVYIRPQSRNQNITRTGFRGRSLEEIGLQQVQASTDGERRPGDGRGWRSCVEVKKPYLQLSTLLGFMAECPNVEFVTKQARNGRRCNCLASIGRLISKGKVDKEVEVVLLLGSPHTNCGVQLKIIKSSVSSCA